MKSPLKLLIVLFMAISTYSFIVEKNIIDGKKTIVKRPNILFCIADDWGWPHASILGDAAVSTPTFDGLAKAGVLFDHAYVSSPSCTPSRSAILTGQYHWRLGESANLWSTLDKNIPVYPLLLEESGYHVGYWRKCWGPGDIKAGGYTDTYPGGKNYPDGFKQFLDSRKSDEPFCFWLGASDPHRSYKKGSGKESGIDLAKVKVPGFYPDVEEIRSDIADYYYEVQRFDRDVGQAIKMLEEIGELENTIIVMTGDHGMPFPRCKSNLYDMGVRVPLVLRWGNKVKGNRVIKDFVSLTDLATTFLDASEVNIPNQMTGESLLPILLSNKDGWIESNRDHVVFGKERHVPGQLAPSLDGYPSRGIRTEQYLYIHNMDANRWPTGVPEGSTHPMNVFPDCDNGPTKKFLIEHAGDSAYNPFFELSFAKRPTEELYDIINDPDQINNLADSSNYQQVKSELSLKLSTILKYTKDPRIIGGGEKFDEYPYRAEYKLNERK